MKRVLTALACVALALAALAGCSAGASATEHPAAVAVRELLTLRSAGSTDATAYASYLADRSLADALAESAVPGKSAVPGLDVPYVSELTSATANVVVKWRADESAFPGWPGATVFAMRLEGGRWTVIDALDPTGTVPPAASAADLAPAMLNTVEK